jgi:ribonuclease HI
MCIRDVHGCFILVKINWFSPLCSVDTSEALGLFHSLQWVAELGFDNMDIVLDSKTYVDDFKGGSNHYYKMVKKWHPFNSAYNTKAL